MLAYVVIAKFCVPCFYRQEKQFLRLVIEISRATICGWAMKAAESCQGILDLLYNEIRGGPLINVDETTVQVLDEPDGQQHKNRICGYFEVDRQAIP